MIPKELLLTSWVEGDTWSGIPVVRIKVGPNGGPYAAPASPLQTVRMRFAPDNEVPNAAIEISSADEDQIEITDADEWEFTVKEQIVTGLTYGIKKWQITTTSAAGEVRTYFSDTVEILKKI